MTVRLLAGVLALCAAASLLACGSQGDPAGVAPTVTNGSATYRFARPPVVIFASDKGPPGYLWVFARMNRELPRDAGGGLEPTFTLDRGSRPIAAPVTRSQQPACYAAEISAGDNPRAPQNVAAPHDGGRVTVTLRFPGHDGASATVAAHGVPFSGVYSDRANAHYLRDLGCALTAVGAPAPPPPTSLAATPVVIKLGSTFEVRARFRGALPHLDSTGAAAEFSLGPSTIDHAPTVMRGSRGHCYRETLYNDDNKAVLRQAHAGSRLTLRIVVHGQSPAIVRRVRLTGDVNAAPAGCAPPRSG
jgi:hypothetical protein